MKQTLVVGPESAMGPLASALESWGASITRAQDSSGAMANLSCLLFDLVAIGGGVAPTPPLLDACRKAGSPALLLLGAPAGGEPTYEPRLVWPQDAPIELLRTPCQTLVRAAKHASLLHGISALAGGPIDARGAVTWAARHLGTWAALYLADQEGALSLAAASPDVPVLPGTLEPDKGELGKALNSGTYVRTGEWFTVPLGLEGSKDGLLVVGQEPGRGTELDLAQVARVAALVMATRLARQAAPAGGSTMESGQAMAFEKLASLAQLSAGISHEINNPLFVIMGTLDLLAKKVPAESRGMFAQTIRAADRIRKIVADMRRFYMPGQRGETGPIDLNELVSSVSQIVSLHPSFEKVEVVHDLAPRLPKVEADDNQMLQVLMNLMTNAAQSMTSGGKVTVRTRQEGKEVVLTVSDQGCGIAPESLGKIFDPFFTTKSDWTGTGLGLSVTYAILKNHGGSIDVASELGKGTTVTVKLPAYTARRRLSDLEEGGRTL